MGRCSVIKLIRLDKFWCNKGCGVIENYRKNQKGGTASLRSRTCVKRNVAFGARFKGLSLYFLYQNGKLIRIKTGLDTYQINGKLIRIETGLDTYLIRIQPVPPCDL